MNMSAGFRGGIHHEHDCHDMPCSCMEFMMNMTAGFRFRFRFRFMMNSTPKPCSHGLDSGSGSGKLDSCG